MFDFNLSFKKYFFVHFIIFQTYVLISYFRIWGIKKYFFKERTKIMFGLMEDDEME